MSDTLELVEIEELLDLRVPCEICEEHGHPTEAHWIAQHGNPDCSYLLCNQHLEQLKQYIADHERHHATTPAHVCLLHCLKCGQDFDPLGKVLWRHI